MRSQEYPNSEQTHRLNKCALHQPELKSHMLSLAMRCCMLSRPSLTLPVAGGSLASEVEIPMLNSAVLAVQCLMKDSRWRKLVSPFPCRDSFWC